jgi:hypothetical protein
MTQRQATRIVRGAELRSRARPKADAGIPALQAAQRVNLLAVIAYLEESAQTVRETLERPVDHPLGRMERIRWTLAVSGSGGDTDALQTGAGTSACFRRRIPPCVPTYLIRPLRPARLATALRRVSTSRAGRRFPVRRGLRCCAAIRSGRNPDRLRRFLALRCSLSSSSTCVRTASHSAGRGSRIFSFLR